MKNDFKPLVSIVIPVFNGEKYLKEAIDSALAQTYKNTEIIVVNEDSKDKTEEIILSYKDKVRYFKKENGGVATALNLAIKEAKGEYISWLSHDDLYESDKLAIQVAALAELKNKKTILYSDWKYIDENGRLTAVSELEKSHDKKSLGNGFYALLNWIISGCTLLVKKEIFEEFGYFDASLLTTQDYDLWFRVFRKYPVKHIPKILVSSREHQGQDSRSRRAFHLKEMDELWVKFITAFTSEQLDKLFIKKVDYLAHRAKLLYHLFIFNGAIEAMLKIQTDKQLNVLILNPNENFDESSYQDKNIFILKVLGDNFSLYYEKVELLSIKLKSSIGFEFNNMFLQNEVTSLIEKLMIAFNIDLFHIFKVQDSGFDVIQAAKRASVPILYSVNDSQELWFNPANIEVQNQIDLFAKKYVFSDIDHIIVKKSDEKRFKTLLEKNEQIKYSLQDKKDFYSANKINESYDLMLKDKKKKRNQLKIRKLLINDLLAKQENSEMN